MRCLMLLFNANFYFLLFPANIPIHATPSELRMNQPCLKLLGLWQEPWKLLATGWVVGDFLGVS